MKSFILVDTTSHDIPERIFSLANLLQSLEQSDFQSSVIIQQSNYKI